jgi:SIR2-like protein
MMATAASTSVAPVPSVASGTPAAVATPSDQALPCPYRQARLLQQSLVPDKMRVGFFLGAGCPLAVDIPPGTGTWPLIPNIEGLTDIIRSSLGADPTHKDRFQKILDQIGDNPATKKTVEQMLTRLRALLEVVESTPFDGLTRNDLIALDKAICKAIDSVMRRRLPARSTPYHQLAAWIGSITRAHPVEIFTSNYDLLMEQALEECGVPYFDGFSGSDRTFFDVPSMEQLTLPPRWARLWKVHGSINWWKTKNGDIQRREIGDTDASQMIHPSHLKYDESRKMPYLAMQDRLRSFLARGQAVLVTCGYSFLDGHLNHAILDGLGGNPSAVCFGLVYGDRAAAAAAIEKVGHRGNLRLLGADGGVLGTISRDWHSTQDIENPFHGNAVCVGPLPKRTAAPDDRCKFCLGDFKSLGAFLADQLAGRSQFEENGNAT